MLNRRFLITLSAAALLAACATPHPAPVSVAERIARDPQLSTLNMLIQKAGLAETLKAGGPYTYGADAPDLIATNGVVHTVDRVLLPPVRR